MTTLTVDLISPYEVREQFKLLHTRDTRWFIGVAHRRAGKTVADINELIIGALKCRRANPRFAYVAPQLNQAKDIAWVYLKEYTQFLRPKINESELYVDLPGGARIRIYGADNPDRLRGIYLDGVVLDEFGDMDPTIWTQVIRPALSDRNGWACFIGTPKGKNTFHRLWTEAEDSQMATMLYVIVDPAASTVRWVNAGHPPPLLIGEGQVEFLQGDASVPLGVLPFPTYEEVTAPLAPGHSLLLYTDGLVERPGEHLDEGLGRLAACLREATENTHELLEHVVDTLVPAGGAPDDVALLILRNLPVPARFSAELPS